MIAVPPPSYVPVSPPAIEELKIRMKAHWNQYFTIAQRFYKTAEGCINDDWPEQALFNLHQSTQHSCMALLRVFIGYRSATHNLSRLLELIENFSEKPSTIFPCVTQEETELFNLLNKSYSDARYREKYKVPMEKAQILKRRVKAFMELSEKLYTAHLQNLAAQASVSFPIINSHVNE